MRLIVSRIIRLLKNDIVPSNCYYYQYLPFSLDEKCDCEIFCKFPPKGNNQCFNLCNL